MVKNESKIIKRTLENACPWVDAVQLVDTGSTDNTVEEGRCCLEKLGVPFEIACHTWQNFGHNRTLSLQSACESVSAGKFHSSDLSEWFGLLLDADMLMKGDLPEMKKCLRGSIGARLFQKSPALVYENVRFVSLKDPWVCEGYTHEVWQLHNSSESTVTIPESIAYIEDIGDGGCKEEKFTRDEFLLKKALADGHDPARTFFYLAQTLWALRKCDEAIEAYKKRIQAGGWWEEIWYSCFALMQIYIHLDNTKEAEYWAQTAMERDYRRAEAPISLVTHLRCKSEHHKAWHYLQKAKDCKLPSAALFLEPAYYDEKQIYEESILHFYVKSDRNEGMRISVNYHGENEEQVWLNSKFYALPLNANWELLQFPVESGYRSSSISVSDEGVLNVRTVNYYITDEGDYRVDTLSGLPQVHTINYCSSWDADKLRWDGWQRVPESEELLRLKTRTPDILGLEDIRLVNGQFSACTLEYSYNDCYRIIVGSYPSCDDIRVLKPPADTPCEKNWLFTKNDEVIYAYHPLQVGRLGEDNKLTIDRTFETPRWFSRLRGSANPIEVDGELWALTHIVLYEKPRTYLHVMLALGSDLKPLRYTLPFYFKALGVEYCTGMMKHGEFLHIFVSEKDKWSFVCKIKVSDFKTKFYEI